MAPKDPSKLDALEAPCPRCEHKRDEALISNPHELCERHQIIREGAFLTKSLRFTSNRLGYSAEMMVFQELEDAGVNGLVRGSYGLRRQDRQVPRYSYVVDLHST